MTQPDSTPLKFETADYYKLRTVIGEAEKAAAIALVAIKRKDALVRDLAAKYSFDPAFVRWQANDDTEEFSFS